MGEEATTGPVPAETTPQSSIDLVPVLQIVHVTDLHVKEASANPIAVLSKGIRLRARFAQQFLARRHQATQGVQVRGGRVRGRPGRRRLLFSAVHHTPPALRYKARAGA